MCAKKWAILRWMVGSVLTMVKEHAVMYPVDLLKVC